MLEIISYPNKILRTSCVDIEDINKDIIDLANQLWFMLDIKNGLGLAAPQIGKNINLFVMQQEGQDVPLACVNPKIIAYSEDTKPYREGCLSIPGFRAVVHRPAEILFEYKDLTGKTLSATMSGVDAVVAQHEYDHLQGVLFVDKIPKILQQNFIGKYGYDKYKSRER